MLWHIGRYSSTVLSVFESHATGAQRAHITHLLCYWVGRFKALGGQVNDHACMHLYENETVSSKAFNALDERLEALLLSFISERITHVYIH